MIWVVAGPTGGHIYPAIALLDQLKEDAYFVVSREYPANQILKPYGYQMGVGSLKWGGFGQWINIIQKLIANQPKLICLMGGGVCVPVAIVSWVFKIPCVSFEQNTIPGKATRINQWIVDAIITTFESTKWRLIKQKKVRCLGNPIRLNPIHNQGLDLPLPKQPGRVLLVLGGSQGAKALNTFMAKYKDDILKAGVHIIHITGEKQVDHVAETTQVNGQVYIKRPFIQNMMHVYQVATHVMCRSGATTLAELWAYGHPSLLVPFPYSTDHHQIQNAKEFVQTMPNSQWVEESQLTIQVVHQFIANQKQNSKKPRCNPQQIQDSICDFIQSYLE